MVDVDHVTGKSAYIVTVRLTDEFAGWCGTVVSMIAGVTVDGTRTAGQVLVPGQLVLGGVGAREREHCARSNLAQLGGWGETAVVEGWDLATWRRRGCYRCNIKLKPGC